VSRLGSALSSLRGRTIGNGPPGFPAVPPVRREWLALLVLGLAALVLLLVFAGQPLLYAAETGAVSPYHEDLTATGRLTRDDGSLVLPEWATSLNAAQSVVLDIRLGDLDAASASLDAYLRSGRSLSSLVFRLDMTETDVAEFNRNNTANVASLRRLLNQTEEFARLDALEVRYRDENDAAMLRSVQLQGEELRKAVEANYRGYAARQGAMVNISQHYGLDTSQYEESVLEFAAVVAALGARQDERATSVSGAVREIQREAAVSGDLAAITFEIVPDRGIYGDVLAMRGTVSRPAGTGVTIYLDGRLLAGVQSQGGGGFEFPYRVGKIESGQHEAYASAGAAISAERTFRVAVRNTTTTFAVERLEANGTAFCTGSVATEDGVPVRGGTVGIAVDGGWWEVGETRDDGTFAIDATSLEPGRHRLTAEFDPEGFPLNGSGSAPVDVLVPSIWDWLRPLLYLLGVGAAGAGAVLYLRRRGAAGEGGVALPGGPPPEPVIELPPAPTVDEAEQAAALLAEGVDGREAVTRLYRRLVRELDARHPGQALPSLTPREIAARFASGPTGGDLATLVRVHERVRYAGCDPTEEDIRTVNKAFIHVITEGGDD